MTITTSAAGTAVARFGRELAHAFGRAVVMWDVDRCRKLCGLLSGGPWGDRGPEALERIERLGGNGHQPAIRVVWQSPYGAVQRHRGG